MHVAVFCSEVLYSQTLYDNPACPVLLFLCFLVLLVPVQQGQHDVRCR